MTKIVSFILYLGILAMFFGGVIFLMSISVYFIYNTIGLFDDPYFEELRAEGVSQSDKEEILLINGSLDSQLSKTEFYATITAYCLTSKMANGEYPKEGSVACPLRFEFGQKLQIGSVWGYTCEDRMDVPYRDTESEWFIEERFDIWMEDCNEAWNWGVKIIKIRIL